MKNLNLDNLYNKYIRLILSLFFAITCFINLFYMHNINTTLYYVILFLASITMAKDLQKDISLKSFFIKSFPIVVFLIFIQKYGYTIWGKVLQWQVTKGLGGDWNEIFKNIPYNDAAFARFYQPEWLNIFFRFVYNNGFVLPVIIPLYRAFACKDLKKMIRYALSGHVLQIFLISPFYAAIRLQEVWYVLGHPDMLNRNFTPEQAAGWTLNCFPSMHTSIAFAMFLLALREKDKVFKYIWSFFCLSVVYSTMYLKIHWVIDVIGGIILALITVKLVDFIFNIFEKKSSKFINHTK